MEIEARGSLEFLNGLALELRNEFEKNGYSEGPRLGRMDVGTCWTLLKEERIVTMQVTEGSESEEATLQLESEQDVAMVNEIWDNALVSYGHNIISKIITLARDSKKVEKALLR